MPDMRDVYDAWRPHVASMGSWRELATSSPEHVTDFGDIHPLPNLAGRRGEGIAIVDMSDNDFIYPRYNVGSYMICFALDGSAYAAVGHEERRVHRGDVLFVRPSEPYFMATARFIAAVVTAPTLTAERVIPIDESHPTPRFDRNLFRKIAFGQPA